MELTPLKHDEIRVLAIRTLSNDSSQQTGRSRNVFSSNFTFGPTEYTGAVRLFPSNDIVECTIENVSLTAYTPSYLQFKDTTNWQEAQVWLDKKHMFGHARRRAPAMTH